MEYTGFVNWRGEGLNIVMEYYILLYNQNMFKCINVYNSCDYFVKYIIV